VGVAKARRPWQEEYMDGKTNLGVNAFLYPMPVMLVGTQVEGRANFMAVAWATRVNGNPPMMGVALNQRHHTPTGIHASGSFSINIPSVDLVAPTDYCGLVSGRETDKSELFELFYGELGNAPMIKECPLCIECRLVNVVSLPSHFLFLGEVVAVFADEDCLTDGKPDIQKLDPFVLTMPDNRYWAVGRQIGNAWSIGREFER
jgi:flavin reductase (DIM6/NTAB) family NADH-FMN oxidoreductase RutF